MKTPAVPVQTEAKPNSIKVEPWSDFPKQSYAIHGDDFVHTKPFVAKFNAKGSRSTLNIKQTVSVLKQGNFIVDDDVKLWFDLPSSKSFYTRVKSTNYLKVHYDHGICSYKGKQWNMYASLWTNKTLTHSSFRVGAASIHPKCNSDNRMKVQIKSGSHQLYWYNRTLSNFNQFKLGVVSVVDLSNKVLQKNNILLGYTINQKNEAFIRLQNLRFRTINPNWNSLKSYWDTVTLNYVGKIDSKTKYGIEAAWNITDNKVQNVEAVLETKIPNHGITLKIKANHKKDFALALKKGLWGLEDIATISAGVGVSNAFSDKQSLKNGLQINFNI